MKTLTSAIVVLSAGYAAADTLPTDFYPGSGNSNTNFHIATDGDMLIGVKAKARFLGDVAATGNTYFVEPGFSAGSTNRAWWNYDWSVDLGSNTPDTVDVYATISWNDNGDFRSFQGHLDAVPGSGPFFEYRTEITNALGTDSQVYQNSSNIGFFPTSLFWDPNLITTYTITFGIYNEDDFPNNPNGSGPLLQSQIFVQVIPTPAAAGMGMLGLGLVAARRRRA